MRYELYFWPVVYPIREFHIGNSYPKNSLPVLYHTDHSLDNDSKGYA